MNERTQQKHHSYTSKDGLIEIKTTRNARRWPPHDYPCVVVVLKPQQGTRVLRMEDGRTEWMPRHSEILALILQMGLKVTAAPSDKPEARRIRWQRINAQRHGRRAA